MTTSLTLKDDNGTFTVEVPRDGMTLADVLEALVQPVLLAAGYSKDSVKAEIAAELSESSGT